MPSDSDSKGDGPEGADPEKAAAPEPVGKDESAPIASGGVKVARAADATGPTEMPGSRSKRISTAVQDVVSGGVEVLGSGMNKLGEGVTRLGDVLPIVGAGVSKIGEGLSKAGEAVNVFPKVAQTRRGRVLVRSVVVGFAVVAAWIAVIVGWNYSENDLPDFRPAAEHILVEISKGPEAIGNVYEKSSPRFQEMVRKERFVDDYTDMNATLGKFHEVTAINGTLVTTGTTGRVGRVSLTASYDKGICRGSISFHYDQGEWKLLGISVEVPPELKISQAQREERVKACADPMDTVKCDVNVVANAILKQLRDDKSGEVWDNATPVFQQQVTRAKFVALQAEHNAALGNYRRIVSVTEAKVIGGTSATFDVLAEFDRSSAVRVVFAFYRGTKTSEWKLRSMKIVLPMPRADEEQQQHATPPVPPPTHEPPHDAGLTAPADAKR